MSEFVILAISFISSLVVSIIFGCITSHINESKGHDGGFWWGFFLGWIGIIVVAVRQPAYSSYTPSVSRSEHKAQQELRQLKQQQEQQKAYASQITLIQSKKAIHQDIMEQFLILAAQCKTDADLRAFWEHLRPAENPEIEALLKQREQEFVMTGTSHCQESLICIKQAYLPDPPKAETPVQKTLEKDYDPNKKWVCPACGAENVAFKLRCGKCGHLK